MRWRLTWIPNKKNNRRFVYKDFVYYLCGVLYSINMTKYNLKTLTTQHLEGVDVGGGQEIVPSKCYNLTDNQGTSTVWVIFDFTPEMWSGYFINQFYTDEGEKESIRLYASQLLACNSVMLDGDKWFFEPIYIEGPYMPLVCFSKSAFEFYQSFLSQDDIAELEQYAVSYESIRHKYKIMGIPQFWHPLPEPEARMYNMRSMVSVPTFAEFKEKISHILKS